MTLAALVLGLAFGSESVQAQVPAAPAPQTSAPEPSVREDPSLIEQKPAPPALKEEPEAAQSLGLLLVKMLLGLAATVGAIYLSLAYVARRLSQFPAMKGKVVRVTERVPLDPRRTLFVIEAAGEYLLVGSGEGPMALIAKLDADAVRRSLAESEAAAAASPKPFWLRLLEKRHGGGR